MKRLVTAAVAVPLMLAGIFYLPNLLFFVVILVAVLWASVEYVDLMAPQAPAAPRWLVLLFVPPAAAAAAWILTPGANPPAEAVLLVGGLFFGVGLGTLVLLSGGPPDQAVRALGIVGFGVPYFAFPIAAMVVLQRVDPWLVLLLCAIVWLGDTAAYYFGSAFGTHRMAPIVSPKKSWEGAAASLVTAVVAAVIWCWWREGRIDGPLIAVAAAVAVASQLGDLVESLLKRGAKVKDSGSVFPGHGGVLDRIDAMLFGAPVLLAGLWAIGWDGLVL